MAEKENLSHLVNFSENEVFSDSEQYDVQHIDL